MARIHEIASTEAFEQLCAVPQAVQASHEVQIKGGTAADPVVIASARAPRPGLYSLYGRSVVRAEKGGTYVVHHSATLEVTGGHAFQAHDQAQVRAIRTRGEGRGHARVITQESSVEVFEQAEVETADLPDTPANISSRLLVHGRARALVRGRARAEVSEDGQAEGFDDARIDVRSTFGGTNSASVVVHDRATCAVRGAPGDRILIIADGSAQVLIEGVPGAGRYTIEARGHARVIVQNGDASVLLLEDAQATVGARCRVQARGRARVVARRGAQVELSDGATVEAPGGWWDVDVRDLRTATPAATAAPAPTRP